MIQDSDSDSTDSVPWVYIRTPITVLSDFRENPTRHLQSIGKYRYYVRAFGATGKPDADPSDLHRNN
jgi:hypothetical protein